MRFLLIFGKKTVPEWKECYYDYVNIKSLIILCKKAYAIRCNIEDLSRYDNYHLDENQTLIRYKQLLQMIRIDKCDKINAIIIEANMLFYRFHSISKRVVFLFCQYKIHELNGRLTKYSEWQSLVDESKSSLTELLSNCYAENIKLETMTQLHLQAYQKIHKKHEKAFKQFGLSTPGRRTARLARTLLDMDRYTERLETTLDSYQQVVQRENKYKLQQQVEPSPFKRSIMSYLFGLLNGFSICAIIAAIILLSLDIGVNDVTDTGLPRKKVIFQNQYRLWKGTGCIVLYIWIFAIAFYIYEQKGVNYNLIFDYKTKTQKSIVSLLSATFLTILWSSFFIFYCMEVVGIYKVAYVGINGQLPITIFFPLIIFIVFMLSIVVQFIRTRRGVLYFAFITLKVLLTPFGFYQINFGVIWATEQFLSLVIIIYDIAYSFCYYIVMLYTPTVADNPCFNFIVMVQIMAITIFVLRLLQSVRMAIQKKQFWCTRQMFRAIRAVLNILVGALSIASIKQNQAILWIWIFFAIICGVYSFIIDSLLDWSLFFVVRDSNGRFKLVRRQQNLFSIRKITFMMVVDLICRWTFSLLVCPRIVFVYIPYPQLVMAIAEGLQMCRRLIWNILRVENQQIKHNYFFQIRTNYDTNENKIIKQLEKRNIKYSKTPQIENERAITEVETLREYIREKNKWQQIVIEFYQKHNKLLQQLEDESQRQIVKIVGQIK